MVDFAVGSAFEVAFTGLQSQITLLAAAVNFLIQCVVVVGSFLLFIMIVLALWGQLNK